MSLSALFLFQFGEFLAMVVLLRVKRLTVKS